MEDGHTAERTARPLCNVPFPFWMDGLEERADERNFEARTADGPFPPKVHDYKASEQLSAASSWCKVLDSLLGNITLIVNHESE